MVCTIQSQTVTKTMVLLLKTDCLSIDAITDKIAMNRRSTILCINKYLEASVENDLFDAPVHDHNAEITDDGKT